MGNNLEVYHRPTFIIVDLQTILHDTLQVQGWTK
jgi:hypothetical protein